MTHPLSTDLRKRVISAVEGGQSRRSAARRFGVVRAGLSRSPWAETGIRTERKPMPTKFWR